jgi:hypothetical protein
MSDPRFKRSQAIHSSAAFIHAFPGTVDQCALEKRMQDKSREIVHLRRRCAPSRPDADAIVRVNTAGAHDSCSVAPIVRAGLDYSKLVR